MRVRRQQRVMSRMNIYVIITSCLTSGGDSEADPLFMRLQTMDKALSLSSSLSCSFLPSSTLLLSAVLMLG